MQIWTTLAVAFGILLILFTVVWLIQRSTGNASIIDAFWSYSFPLVSLVYALRSEVITERKWLALLLVFLWGGRLGTYLLFRSAGHPEDKRYTALRQKWGAQQQVRMLRFYYVQAITVMLLSVPFLVIMKDESPDLTAIHWLATAIAAIGIAGETLADYQLSRFKKTARAGALFVTGLWKYTRHPNYFFEWTTWLGFALFAISSPTGWLAWLSPLLMYLVLTKLTGIGHTERHLLATRGKAYSDYQSKTSAFFPWFPGS